MPVPAALLHALHRAVADARAAARSATRRTLLLEGTVQLLLVAVGVAQLRLLDEEFGGPITTVALTAFTAAVVLLRRVWPAAAVVAVAPLVVTGPSLVALVAVPVVVFAAGRRLHAARLWTVTATAAGVALVSSVVHWGYQGEPADVVLIGWALSVVLLLVVPAGYGALIGQQWPAGRLLRERIAHLERTRELIALRARRNERTRIADEMHDMLGHRLSLLSVHAGALEVQTARTAPEVRDQAELVRGTAGAALVELREILQLTQGASSTDPGGRAEAPAGTRGDVEALVARSREAGLDVELRWTGDDRGGAGGVDARVRQAIHRAVREGLTNVHKHAPATPRVDVEVDIREGRARVTVTNAAPVPGLPEGVGTRRGLVGLEERAALLGGTCRGRATADGGFVLALDVPTAPGGLVPVAPAAPDAPDADLEEPRALRNVQTVSTGRMVAVVAVTLLVVVAVLVVLLLTIIPLIGGGLQ